jgi:hypothetical protein
LTKPILSSSEQTGTVGVVEGRGSINGRDKKEKCSDRKENSGGNNIYQLVNQNISNHQFCTGQEYINIAQNLILISMNLSKLFPSNPRTI